MSKGMLLSLAEELVRQKSYEESLRSTCELCGATTRKISLDESAVANRILVELDRGIFKGSFDVKRQNVEGNRYNIIASLGEPKLLLAGHMDTVQPGDFSLWTITPPLEPRILDNRLYGLGALDMKGGLAAILTAAREALESNVQGLWLLFDVDEEYYFKGMSKFVEEFKISPELALFAEPTDLRIINSHRGCYELHLKIRGKGAHAGQPEQGVDASKTYSILQTIRSEIVGGQFSHKILGNATLNIGYFHAGTSDEDSGIVARANRVPDAVHAVIDVRPTLGLRLDWLIAELKSKLADHKLRLDELNIEINRPPLIVEPEKLRVVHKAVEEVGLEARHDTFHGYTEAGVLHEETGVAAFSLGPGPSEMAHKPNEYVNVHELTKCIEIYRRVILAMCH